MISWDCKWLEYINKSGSNRFAQALGQITKYKSLNFVDLQTYEKNEQIRDYRIQNLLSALETLRLQLQTRWVHSV